MSRPAVRLAMWVYRTLLRLYPRVFRDEYGELMADAFERLACVSYTSTRYRGLAVLLFSAVVDTARFAGTEHWGQWVERNRRRVARSMERSLGDGFVASIGQDFRYAARALLRQPGFAAAAIATLALGIGVNTAIFSVVHGVLLRPLPYRDGHQLVVVRQQSPAAGVQGFSVKELQDYRAQTTTLTDVVEYHSLWFSLVGRGDPERVLSGVVSWQFFDLMGVQPHLGRLFQPADDRLGSPPVLVLSHAYWQRSFAGDSSVVGQTVRMNDQVYTIVGVLPPVPQYPRENDVYMPTVSCPFRSSPGWIENRAVRPLTMFSRVREEVAAPEIATDLAAVAQRQRSAHPESYARFHEGHEIVTTPLHEELTRAARPTLFVLLGTVGLVLLIACANVANLTLSRLVRREREMAVRAALGAGRVRLGRQLVTESTLLALVGGAIGLVVAWAGLDLLIAFVERFTPRAREVEINTTVLGFTLLVSCATGLIFGLLPVLPSKLDLATALREGGSRLTGGTNGNRMRHMLIVAQLSLSFMLLIGAGLMVRTMVNLQAVDPGFDGENVVTMNVAMPFSRDNAQTMTFTSRLLDRVTHLPGVQAAALGTAFPLSQFANPFPDAFDVEGRFAARAADRPQADVRLVSARYFETIRQPLLAGVLFTDDPEAAPTVVVNQSLAARFFPGEDAVGKRITPDRGTTWWEIVGVVGDVKQRGLDREVQDEFYLNFFQGPSRNTRLLLRGIGAPLEWAWQVRAAIRDLDPDVAVADVETLDHVRQEALASPRLTATLLGLFAALALAITATGIAGVIGFSVSQRTNEIGVRMALGQGRWGVLAMILTQGMGLVVIGLVVGWAGAIGITRLMAGLVYGVAPTDIFTFLGVAAVLATVALAATLVPARRATTIDPMTALRSD